jgi:hypothetical protein
MVYDEPGISGLFVSVTFSPYAEAFDEMATVTVTGEVVGDCTALVSVEEEIRRRRRKRRGKVWGCGRGRFISFIFLNFSVLTVMMSLLCSEDRIEPEVLLFVKLLQCSLLRIHLSMPADPDVVSIVPPEGLATKSNQQSAEKYGNSCDCCCGQSSGVSQRGQVKVPRGREE